MTDLRSTAVLVPSDLEIAAGGDHFPVSGPTPQLSWLLPSDAVRQTHCWLEARIDGTVLTHDQAGPEHRLIAWPWRPLTSGQRVAWRVRTGDRATTSGWSEWHQFEAGLFEADWTAQWISPGAGGDQPLGERPAYALSTAFTVPTSITDARLYSSALGVYEIFINGSRVGTAELSPGSTSYDRTVYGQAADVRPLLARGENLIEMVLSDGWFRGRNGAFRTAAEWGTATAGRVQLEFRTADGTRHTVTSDTTWTVSDTQIRQADLMDGQITDFTYQPRPIGTAAGGPAGIPAVTWSPAPPVRVTAERSPVSISSLSDDVLIIDFGQNASGRIRLNALGSVGTRTVIDYGEHLDHDGNLTLTHLDTANPAGGVVSFAQHDEVVSSGNPAEYFEPRHTLHGFRYARITRPGIDLSTDDIIMQVMNTDLRPVGAFACSDDDINALHRAADWSFRGNAVDVPTDCPTRERAGWTGDYQIFLSTAERLYDVNGFSRKWLQSVRDDQLDDGRIVNISPDPGRLRTVPNPMVDMATGSAGWGDAIVIVPWELYRTYGDRTVLEENWDAATRWLDFALVAAAENRHPDRVKRFADPLPHERYIWDGTFHFGEWNEPGFDLATDPMAWAMADKGEVGTAYLYRSTSLLAATAAVLGKHDDAARYADIAERVRDAWRTEFLDADGRTTAATQASYVRALTFDLVPPELHSRAAAHLIDLIHDSDTHLGTGFLATADLLPALADTGHADIAYALLTQRTTPSWLGMLDRGATTIWEEWNGVDESGTAHASLNHYSKGAVIRFLHSHTLGFQQDPDSVAWAQFTVAPIVPDGLTWARGHYDSPQGRIEISWHLDADAVLSVTVPGGAEATVRWGQLQRLLPPGRHTIRTARTAVALAAADPEGHDPGSTVPPINRGRVDSTVVTAGLANGLADAISIDPIDSTPRPAPIASEPRTR